jgi:hypothetical protein
MKKKHIPAKKNAAPAKKAEQPIIEAHVKRLIDMGMTQKEIEEKLKDPEARIVLYSAYSSYQLKIGKKTYQAGKAIEYTLNKAKIGVLSNGKDYGYILTKKNDVPSILDLLKGMGRLYVRKWDPIVKKKHSPKKPTNNTAEVKINAKKSRKATKLQDNKMRAFYAAKRNGGVSERIKIHNPKLAAEIEAWLKTNGTKKKSIKRKNSNIGPHMPKAVLKLSKAIKKSTQQVVKAEKKKAVEAKRMALNVERKAAIAKKKSSNKEQTLNLAA